MKALLKWLKRLSTPKIPIPKYTNHNAVFFVNGRRLFIPKGTALYFSSLITEDKKTWPSKP